MKIGIFNIGQRSENEFWLDFDHEFDRRIFDHPQVSATRRIGGLTRVEATSINQLIMIVSEIEISLIDQFGPDVVDWSYVIHQFNPTFFIFGKTCDPTLYHVIAEFSSGSDFWILSVNAEGTGMISYGDALLREQQLNLPETLVELERLDPNFPDHVNKHRHFVINVISTLNK